jgi:NADPH2:quinone reductase
MVDTRSRYHPFFFRDSDDLKPTSHIMKAVVINKPGDISSLHYTTTHPKPTLQPGHALIKNEFIGLNFIDTYHRSGLYPRDTPFVLGQEGGGVVAAISQEEERSCSTTTTSSSASSLSIQVGDRVVYGSFGSYAEYTSVPIDKLVPIPDRLDTSIAVACMTQGLTAHYLSSSVGNGIAKRGDWVLIYGVGSGTCQWTAQMCKLRGFKVIGTTSRYKIEGMMDDDGVDASKVANRFGCDNLIVLENTLNKSYADYTSVDIATQVDTITNGQGCKLIIDGIGKSTYDISLQCLSKRGLFVSFGNASGSVPAFPVLRLLPQSAYVTRPKLNDYIATREELLERANEVFGWVMEGKIRIVVDRVFELEEVAKGHEYLEEGRGRGKILFKC